MESLFGAAVLLTNSQQWKDVFERVPTAEEAGGVDDAVVSEGGGWDAVLLGEVQERGDDDVAGDWGLSGAGEQEPGMVIEPMQDLDIGPSARCQWVKSGCQVSFGGAASNRTTEDLGRLRGSGVIRPAACRIRRIVELDGGRYPSCLRCQAIVIGPASWPAALNSRRNAMIRSRTLFVVAGFDFGRRERGSTASIPPSR